VNARRSPLLALAVAAVSIAPSTAQETAPKPLAMGIQDNSFLIEEAYNQEAGVVQHIFNLGYRVNRLSGPDDREWVLTFTQEWPVFSQTHQFSYTVPYSWEKSGGVRSDGVGDVLLNYRFQAFTETERRPAFAPRLSVILPTGDEDKGFGDGTVGAQINLPVSKVVSERWTVHGNAGLTWLPDVQNRDLQSYNLGASAIYAVSENFNLMLEGVANWEETVEDSGRSRRRLSAIISPGARYAWNLANDTQVVAGIGVPIGLTSEAPDFGVILYFSVEHFFTRPAEQRRQLSVTSSK
jgi:hypothetical protein